MQIASIFSLKGLCTACNCSFTPVRVNGILIAPVSCICIAVFSLITSKKGGPHKALPNKRGQNHGSAMHAHTNCWVATLQIDTNTSRSHLGSIRKIYVKNLSSIEQILCRWFSVNRSRGGLRRWCPRERWALAASVGSLSTTTAGSWLQTALSSPPWTTGRYSGTSHGSSDVSWPHSHFLLRCTVYYTSNHTLCNQ